MMSNPKLFPLDGPFLALSLVVKGNIFETVKQFNGEGITILLSEQDARRSLSMANRGYVFEVGRIVLQGKGRELLGNEYVKRAYLGV